MLIIPREAGQCIVIGGTAIVKVVQVDGDQIKLGIDAPKEISVHRDKIQRQREAGLPEPGGRSVLTIVLGLPD